MGATTKNEHGETQYLYSEIFHSLQGEGHYTGVPCSWLRFFLCNLTCDGFGQKDPTDPSTYKLPYKEIEIDGVKRLVDLPVFEYGCDSSYSWAKKFKHLQHRGTISEISDSIRESLSSRHNPNGNWRNHHMVFTGGEPLMKHSQPASVGLINHWIKEGDYPDSVTYETNGTQKLSEEFISEWEEFQAFNGIELFFSLSPKLFTVTGETAKKAIKPEVIASYHKLSRAGQLKFVVDGTDRSWDELEHVVRQFRDVGVTYPVWIMAVGATVEEQEDIAAKIADQAAERGYNFSARLHAYLYGNQLGT